MQLRGGINAFTQIQIQLYALILGAEAYFTLDFM